LIVAASNLESRRATTPVSAVVFDLGGVLIDWDPRYLYRPLFHGDDEAMERFLATICTREWNRAQDAGRPWSEAVETLAVTHPEHRELIEAYWERWPETLGDAIEPTVDVLAELRASAIPLYALTNWSAETFPLARPRYPFLDWFDGIVISGEVGSAKPDRRVYEVLLERHRLEPDGVIFIDDVAANVAAAAGLGMRAIRFTDAASLRQALAGHGLLAPQATR
jgi:2-haloacid dehalogenase